MSLESHTFHAETPNAEKGVEALQSNLAIEEERRKVLSSETEALMEQVDESRLDESHQGWLTGIRHWFKEQKEASQRREDWIGTHPRTVSRIQNDIKFSEIVNRLIYSGYNTWDPERVIPKARIEANPRLAAAIHDAKIYRARWFRVHGDLEMEQPTARDLAWEEEHMDEILGNKPASN